MEDGDISNILIAYELRYPKYVAFEAYDILNQIPLPAGQGTLTRQVCKVFSNF